ncbi:MAG TPA: hypothetical protein VGG28_21080 [Kofleriaceae bacterium]|jgi:hypothetical protein
MKRFGLFAVLFVTGVACSSSPTNVAGSYSVQLTNGANGCMFQNYTVGSDTMNVPVTVTQSGSTATATVSGVAGDYLNLVLGSDSFTGSVDGDSLDLQLTGTRALSMGNCAYTYNATLNAALDGNSLMGSVDYTADTNNGSDCGALVGCMTSQDIAGSRPPQ